jgi:transposase-like protein
VAKRTYTDRDMANVYVALRVNNDNIARSARDTGVPESTVRDWRSTWERDGGAPQNIIEMAAGAATDFVIDATRLRDKALAELERLIDSGEVKPAQLIAAVAVTEDKIRLAKGLATSRSESVRVDVDPKEVRDQLAKYIQDAIAVTDARDKDINEGEGAEIIQLRPELQTGT